MNDAQTWTVIGLLTTAVFSTVVVSTGAMTRSMLALADGLRGELGGQIGELRAEMRARCDIVDVRFADVDRRVEQVDQRFEPVEHRIGQLKGRTDQLDAKIETLHGDVQYLCRRLPEE